MLIAAIVVGLVTAYHLGIRAGMLGAATAAGLFAAAWVIPGATLYAYVLIGVGLVGVCTLGPRFHSTSGADAKAIRAMRKAASRAYRLLKRIK